MLRPGALGRPRGIRWRGRWEGGLGWGIHVYPRLIHVNKKKNERMTFAATWGKKKELANLDLKNPCCLKIHPNKLQDTKNVIF